MWQTLTRSSKIHKLTLEANPLAPRKELGGRSFFDVTDGNFSWGRYMEAAGGTLLSGYQLRYIYFIDKAKRKDLTVPEIPYSRIDELGAGRYKGETMTLAERDEGKEAVHGEGEGDCDEGDSGEGGNAVHEGAPLQREGGKQ